jgi:trigger factor
MAYTIEEVDKCNKKMTFNFEQIDLSSIIQSKLKEKQKKVDFKGFRKGKVPLSIVEKFYGHEVEHEALNQFVMEQFWKAIDKRNLQV